MSAVHQVLNKYLSNRLMTSCVFSKPSVTVYVTELVVQVQVCLTRMGVWAQQALEFYSLSRASSSADTGRGGAGGGGGFD